MKPYDVEQMRRFLAAAATAANAPRWTLAVVVGLRQGEALGLCWEDVDVDVEPGMLRVRRQLQRVGYRHGCAEPTNCTYLGADGDVHPARRGADCPMRRPGGLTLSAPKSDAGRREIVLVPAIRDELAAHRDRQVADAAANPLWEQGPGGGWVFANGDGAATDPRADHAEFKRLVGLAGVPVRRLHDLRHSAVTMMLGSGLNILAVGQVAGHGSVGQTGEYWHLLADQRAAGAVQVQASFFDAAAPPKQRRSRKPKERG